MGNELNKSLEQLEENLTAFERAVNTEADETHHRGGAQGGHVPLSGKKVTRKSLLTELRRYDNKFVAIPDKKMKRAKEVVEKIKRSFQKYVRENHFNCREIMHQGSVYEGLKVIEPNEFDLLFPVELENSGWKLEQAIDSECDIPGYYFIQKEGYLGGSYWNECIVNDTYLSPVKVGRKMQSVIQKYVKDVTLPNEINFTLRENGPALTLEVCYDDSGHMSIDIVPSIKIRGRMFVAKRHPNADEYQTLRRVDNMYNHIWRESFSEMEKSIIRQMDGMNECRRTCLKILKTIRKKKGKSQLGKLWSYHLKTCLLHLNDDRRIGPWHQDNLDDRFKDLLRKLIKFLSTKKMPSFFDDSVDLFRDFSPIQLQNIEGWLNRIIRSDEKIIDELLTESNTEASSDYALSQDQGDTDRNSSEASGNNWLGTAAAAIGGVAAIGAIGYAVYTGLVAGDKRNPDEAEEDDIGQSTHLVQRRKPLLIELRRYYHYYAAIPVHERKRSIEVVEAIKHSLQRFVRDDNNTTYTFGNIMPQGSSYEGLKVIKPNEFDLLLPLMLTNGEWNYTEAKWKNEESDYEYEVPGYFFITKIRRHIKTAYDNAIVNDDFLSPTKVKRKIQSIVQRAVDQMTVTDVQRVAPRESGPALTLEVEYDYGQRMNIDIVPCIKLIDKLDNTNYKLFVAKRHPEADLYQCPNRNDRNIFNHIWRESFSENEKLIIREMDSKNECRRACLKILKTIQVRKSCPLKGLSSFHLKNCMLHLNKDIDIGPWHQDNLDDRFKDLLLKLNEFLTDEYMPNFFAPAVNLFSHCSETQLHNIRGWLSRVISSSDDKIVNELLEIHRRNFSNVKVRIMEWVWAALFSFFEEQEHQKMDVLLYGY
ncbi:uncharacterized protein LOC117119056 [Anneissia japonica]|uniref:uncharacterized protein LOC117119056 n=1 Tax=Anneissia japonica TaxID=1529436 RepID=UPI001425A086|nr:uncharacterized protein LOC117119056 [Anneissia japonica]